MPLTATRSPSTVRRVPAPAPPSATAWPLAPTAQRSVDPARREGEDLVDRIFRGQTQLQVYERGQLVGGVPWLRAAGFADTMRRDLTRLASKPKGLELLRGLCHSEHPVELRPTWTNPAGYCRPAHGFKKGEPCGATVYMSPDLTDDTLTVFGSQRSIVPLPSFILLGHELIHARAHQRGAARLDGFVPHGWTSAEERRTIGFQENLFLDGNHPITENDLRREHDLPERHGHQVDPEMIRGPRSGGWARQRRIW